MSEDKLRLKILSPQGVLYDGSAQWVTLPGSKGGFSVLERHAPLISSLETGEIRYSVGREEQRLQIASGFVSVKDDKVSICVEI